MKHPLDAHFQLAADESPNKGESTIMLTTGATIQGVVTEYFPTHAQLHLAEGTDGPRTGYLDDWVIDTRHVVAIRWSGDAHA